MEYRKIKKTRWLWLMLFISWSADKWHCNYLSQKYQCEAAELLFKTPFYWLSVLFGVVDLLLGIAIFRRATIKYYACSKEWELFSYSYENENFLGTIMDKRTVKIVVNAWGVEKLASTYIILISVCSLIVDIIKFFF